MKRATLIVELDDYGPAYLKRVRDHLQKSVTDRWPACRIDVTLANGTRQ